MLVFRLYPYVSPVCLLRKPEINVCSKFYSARGAGASCLGVNLVNVPYSVIIVLYAWVAHVLLVIECCYKILLIAPIKLYLCGFCVFIYFFLFNYPFVCLFLFRGRVFYFLCCYFTVIGHEGRRIDGFSYLFFVSIAWIFLVVCSLHPVELHTLNYKLTHHLTLTLHPCLHNHKQIIPLLNLITCVAYSFCYFSPTPTQHYCTAHYQCNWAGAHK